MHSTGFAVGTADLRETRKSLSALASPWTELSVRIWSVDFDVNEHCRGVRCTEAWASMSDRERAVCANVLWISEKRLFAVDDPDSTVISMFAPYSATVVWIVAWEGPQTTPTNKKLKAIRETV